MTATVHINKDDNHLATVFRALYIPFAIMMIVYQSLSVILFRYGVVSHPFEINRITQSLAGVLVVVLFFISWRLLTQDNLRSQQKALRFYVLIWRFLIMALVVDFVLGLMSLVLADMFSVSNMLTWLSYEWFKYLCIALVVFAARKHALNLRILIEETKSNQTAGQLVADSNDLTHKRSHINHLKAIAIVIAVIFGLGLLNELISLVSSQIMGVDYISFPHSWAFNLSLFEDGHSMVLFFAVLSILWGVFLVMGLVGQHVLHRLLLLIALAFYIGQVFAAVVLYLLVDISFSLSPIRFFSLYAQNHFASNLGWFYGSYGLGFAFGIIAVIGGMSKWMTKSKKIHGRARWANLFDLLRWGMLFKRNESLLLGKTLGMNIYSQGFESLLILAPPGGGKSTSFAIPNLMMWQGTSISNDMSMELYRKCVYYLREIKKSDVYLFAPTQLRTHRFNVFHHACDLDFERRYGELQRIMNMIIPESKGGYEKSWPKMARRVLESLAAHQISTTGYCTLGQLAEICCRHDFDKWLTREVVDNDKADAQFKVNASAYLSISATETRSGVKFNFESYLGLYLDPIVRAATEYSDFDLRDLRRKKMDIFVGIPDGHTERLAPLITMFWEEASKCMTDKEPNKETEPYPVLFNMDEFGNMNRVNQIRKNLTILRKYRVRTAIYFQYKDQASEHYTDKDLKAFFNVKTKLIYTQSDIDDAKYLSELFGQTTEKYRTKQHSGERFSTNVSENYHKKPLVTPDDLMNLDEKYGFVSISGRHGLKLKKDYYFKNPQFKKYIPFEIAADRDECLPLQKSITPKIFKMVTAESDQSELDDLRESALKRREQDVKVQEESNAGEVDDHDGDSQQGASSDISDDKNTKDQNNNEDSW